MRQQCLRRLEDNFIDCVLLLAQVPHRSTSDFIDQYCQTIGKALQEHPEESWWLNHKNDLQFGDVIATLDIHRGVLYGG